MKVLSKASVFRITGSSFIQEPLLNYKRGSVCQNVNQGASMPQWKPGWSGETWEHNLNRLARADPSSDRLERLHEHWEGRKSELSTHELHGRHHHRTDSEMGNSGHCDFDSI